MMTQPSPTIYDTNMPVALSAPELGHDTLAPVDADYLRRLVGPSGHSFVIQLADVSPDNLKMRIVGQWPADLGIKEETEHFAGMIADMTIKGMPEVQGNLSLVFTMKFISSRFAASDQQAQIAIPQPNESVFIIGGEARTGDINTVFLQPNPELPYVGTGLNIDSGFIVICQPRLPLVNNSTDHRANGTGPGANVFRMGDRNRDPLSAANDEREQYMGGSQFDAIMKGASPNVIIGNIILIRQLNPAFQKGMGGPNPHLGNEEPPEEDNDNLPRVDNDNMPRAERAGMATEAAEAVGVAELAEHAEGPGGERREHRGHDHYIGGRRAPDIMHQQHVAAELREKQETGLERRMEGERKANEYAALQAEEGTKTAFENAKLGTEFAVSQQEAGSQFVEQEKDLAAEAVSAASELGAAAIEDRLKAADLAHEDLAEGDRTAGAGPEVTAGEGGRPVETAGGEAGGPEAAGAEAGFAAAASEVDAVEPERQESAQAANSEGDNAPDEPITAGDTAEPATENDDNGNGEEALHTIGEALEDDEEATAAEDVEEAETAEAETAEVETSEVESGEGEATAAYEEDKDLQDNAESHANRKAEAKGGEPPHAPDAANDDAIRHGFAHDVAEHAAMHRVVEDIAGSGAAAYAAAGGPLHAASPNGAAAAATRRPMPRAGAAYRGEAARRAAGAANAEFVVVSNAAARPQAANDAFHFTYANVNAPRTGTVRGAKSGSTPVAFSATTLSKGNPFASARSGSLSARGAATGQRRQTGLKQAASRQQTAAQVTPRPARKTTVKPSTQSTQSAQSAQSAQSTPKQTPAKAGPRNIAAVSAKTKPGPQAGMAPAHVPDHHQPAPHDFPTLEVG